MSIQTAIIVLMGIFCVTTLVQSWIHMQSIEQLAKLSKVNHASELDTDKPPSKVKNGLKQNITKAYTMEDSEN
jgi:hypothetical protein